MTFPDDRRYTTDHEWIRLGDDGLAAIGVTDYAQGELGDIVFVELEPEGADVGPDEVFGTVEAVKTVSELFAPVAGTIEAINEALEDAPVLGLWRSRPGSSLVADCLEVGRLDDQGIAFPVAARVAGP